METHAGFHIYHISSMLLELALRKGMFNYFTPFLFLSQLQKLIVLRLHLICFRKGTKWLSQVIYYIVLYKSGHYFSLNCQQI